MATTKITSDNITDGAITSAKLASGVGGVAGIVSSADATAITIDSSENVGIGTASPVRALQVGTHGTGNGEIALGSATNGVGSILFGDGASGADIYRGYVQYNHTDDALLLATNAAERMRIVGNNVLLTGGTDARIVFGTGGAGAAIANDANWIRGEGDNLKYNVAANGFHVYETNGTQRFLIRPDGGMIVGEHATSGAVQPSGLNSGSYQGITYNSPNVSSPRHNYSWSNGLYWWNGSNEGSLAASGAWTNGSDIAFKKNVADIEYGLSTVLDLQPRKYQMKLDSANDIGFIAQEMETIIPEIVHTNENTGYKSLDYGAITAVLVKAMQEQQALIESLTTRLETLENA
jgi:hypothetical protein